VLDVNLTAPFALSCLAAGRMRSNGGGSIVNVASVMGLRSIGQIPDAAYVASKAGIIGLTRELASQWGRYGIRVNAVAPGFFASEMTDSYQPGYLEEQLKRVPLGRPGDPVELTAALVFLASDAGGYVTGQTIAVDGGTTIT
jgi:NAD(P)-dependent dehydrogenase (short-subunit alcohol dehydrogenase family)